jgi:hypothetical protein
MNSMNSLKFKFVNEIKHLPTRWRLRKPSGHPENVKTGLLIESLFRFDPVLIEFVVIVEYAHE